MTDVDDITEVYGAVKVANRTYTSKGANVTHDLDNVKNSNKAQPETFTMLDAAVSTDMLAVVTEATDYSKKSLDNRLAFVEKLLGAKSFDTAIQIQSEYAKTSFEGFVVQATKLGELYSNLAKSLQSVWIGDGQLPRHEAIGFA